METRTYMNLPQQTIATRLFVCIRLSGFDQSNWILVTGAWLLGSFVVDTVWVTLSPIRLGDTTERIRNFFWYR